MLVVGPISACTTEALPSQSASLASSPSPAATLAATATASPTPVASSFFRAPRSIAMSTDVPGRVACEVAPGTTLRLTKLDGTTAYGYESELTPYSEREDDRGTPQDAALYLSACDLATGVVTRLPMPVGYPAVEPSGTVDSAAVIVDIDQGRLLLYGERFRSRDTPDAYLLDPAVGAVEPIPGFIDRHVQPVAIEGDFVIGSQTLDTADGQTVAAVLRLGYDEFRLVTPNDLGLLATWMHPVEIENRIVIGDAENGAVWAFRLDTNEPIDAPPSLSTEYATAGGFDGGTFVGYAYRRGTGGNPQPFAWNIRDPEVTWLPLPRNRTGGTAWDVREGLVIGNTYGQDSGDGEPSWHREKRGIVWDLRTGAFLDLGTGPAELSGTLVADTGLQPESLVAAIEGHQVLGFLGDGLESYPAFYFPASISSFGGTPVVWDISGWLASIR
jgi:hypothetical protein